MKYCPKCNRKYDDEELNFCLDDGTSLLDTADDVTEQMTIDREALKIDINPQAEKKTEVIPAPITTQNNAANQTSQMERSGGVSPLIVGVLLTLLLVVTVGFVGFAVYTFMGKNETVSANVNRNSENKTPVDERNEEVSDLKNEVDKLKDEIANQKKTTEPKDETPKEPPTIEDDPESFLAKVNSPNDGFLALRNIPNHKTGVKIVEIPHGTKIQLFGCQSKRIKVAGRTGRWCKSYYKDQNGWIFDAFVVR